MGKKQLTMSVDERTKMGLKRAAVLMGISMQSLAEQFICKCGQEKYMESAKALEGKNLNPEFKAFHERQLDAYLPFNDMFIEEAEALGADKEGE